MTENRSEQRFPKTKTPPLSKQEILIKLIKLLGAAPIGAAYYYSAFDMIAVQYAPGLWLIIPVTFVGPVIAVSHELLEILTERYPNIKVFENLKKGTDFLHLRLGGFFSDFGYFFNTLLMGSYYVFNKDVSQTLFGRIIAPIVSVPVAIMTSTVSYKKAKNQITANSSVWYIANFIDGLMVLSNPLGMLIQQNLISSSSYWPVGITLGGGVVKLLAAIFYNLSPNIGHLFFLATEILMDNLATSELFFELFPDISSALRGGKVTPQLLFGSAAGGFALWTLLGIMSVLLYRLNNSQLEHPVEQENETTTEQEFIDLATTDHQVINIKQDDEDQEQEQHHSPKRSQSPSASPSLSRFGLFPSSTEEDNQIAERTPLLT